MKQTKREIPASNAIPIHAEFTAEDRISYSWAFIFKFLFGIVSNKEYINWLEKQRTIIATSPFYSTISKKVEFLLGSRYKIEDKCMHFFKKIENDYAVMREYKNAKRVAFYPKNTFNWRDVKKLSSLYDDLEKILSHEWFKDALDGWVEDSSITWENRMYNMWPY